MWDIGSWNLESGCKTTRGRVPGEAPSGMSLVHIWSLIVEQGAQAVNRLGVSFVAWVCQDFAERLCCWRDRRLPSGRISLRLLGPTSGGSEPE